MQIPEVIISGMSYLKKKMLFLWNGQGRPPGLFQGGWIRHRHPLALFVQDSTVKLQIWHGLAICLRGCVGILSCQGCPSFQIGPQYVVSGGEARLDDVSKIVGVRKCSWRFDESNINQDHSWMQDDLGSNMNRNRRWDIWYYLMTLAFLVGMRFLWWTRKLYRLDIKWTWMDINWLSSARRAVASKLQEPVKA